MYIYSSIFVYIPIIACASWWDGIYKWPETPANKIIRIDCHKIFALVAGLGDNHNHASTDPCGGVKYFAYRHCLPDGRWSSGNWTNYTECMNLLAQQVKYDCI